MDGFQDFVVEFQQLFRLHLARLDTCIDNSGDAIRVDGATFEIVSVKEAEDFLGELGRQVVRLRF